MLHLLTDEHRQKVTTEYKKRVLIVFLLGLTVVSLIGAVFSLPVFLAAYGRYSFGLNTEKILTEDITRRGEDQSVQDLRDVELSLETLSMFSGGKTVLNTLENLIKEKTTGVYIKSIIVTPNEDKSRVLDVSGVADTRNSLVLFEKNLKSNAVFKSVYIPLSSFAKEKDIIFSAKIMVSSSTSAEVLQSAENSTHKEI